MSLLSRPYGIGVIAAFAAGACSGNFDTTREARPYEDKASLGQEIYGVLCDRVGASALAEDLDGDSYHALCHPDAKGLYATAVETSHLPPIREGNPVAAMARNLGIAKIETLGRRREDVVKAFDTILPDVEIDDPFAPSGGAKKVRLHTAVAELLQRLNPLYDSNPLAAEGGTPDPLLPATTQALARVLEALIDSQPARDALEQIGGRKGYRPLASALGAISPVLAYPDLRKISQQTVRVLSPGGPAREQFVQLLSVARQELRTAETEIPLGPWALTLPQDRALPNRARENLELVQELAYTTDDAFQMSSLKPALIVLRDHRGFARVAGSQLGLPGSVPAPFSDLDQDGLADVDAFGRFISGTGALVEVDLPFAVPGEPRFRPADSMGRAVFDNDKPAYEYIDTTKTLVASLLLRDVPALLDPEPVNQHETVMDAFAGLVPLLGDREDAMYAYGSGKDQVSIKYRQFVPSTSPLVDLVHAAGQILAHPQSDDLLQQMIDLFENHEQEVARLVGVALRIKEISDQHPEATLDRKVFFWDHMAQVLSEMTDVTQSDPNGGVTGPWNPAESSMIEDMVLSLANDRSAKLADVYAKFFIYRDEMNYDPTNLNGPSVNRTSGDAQPPHLPVDRSKPITAGNKSMFMRSMDIVFDSTRTTACNRPGAQVNLKAGVLGLSADVTYPTDVLFKILLCIGKVKDPLDWCDIFKIEDMTQFYLQSLLEDDPNPPGPLKNPRKAELVVTDACLNSLGGLTDMDKTFEDSSGIKGLTTHPTHTALNRLVFFGAGTPSYTMPDLDPFLGDSNHPNYRTNRFISGLQDPVGTPLCSKVGVHEVNDCKQPQDVLRIRNPGSLFLWEQFGFIDAHRPLLFNFYKYDREDLFSDFVDVVHYHWVDDTHGGECSPTGGYDRDKPGFNARYCSEAGLVRYEELMSEAMQTDLIPALQQIVKVLRDQRIESTRYRRDQGHAQIARRGTEVAAFLTRLLFSEKESQALGLKTLSGKPTVLWSDEKTAKPVTLFALLANAFKGIDDRFAHAEGFTSDELQERQQQWKRARSQLVDQFLAVEGTGADARFKNPAVPKAIVQGLKMLREQLNFHCPDREVGGACAWAKTELTKNVIDVLTDPLFAAIVDLVDALRKEPGRMELERLAQHLLRAIDSDETLHAVLASVVDVVQLLRDGQTIPPILNVLSALSAPDDASGPNGERSKPGAADISLQLLNVLSRDPGDTVGVDDPLVFDRYHTLEHLLPNLVKPIDESKPSETALEVLVDVAADVHRYDSAEAGPLTADDYRVISTSVKEFLTDERRGMEQIYTVVRGAEGD